MFEQQFWCNEYELNTNVLTKQCSLKSTNKHIYNTVYTVYIILLYLRIVYHVLDGAL